MPKMRTRQPRRTGLLGVATLLCGLAGPTVVKDVPPGISWAEVPVETDVRLHDTLLLRNVSICSEWMDSND